MSKVIPGPHMAQMEGSFVVFIIGMRVNNFWKVNKWLPVFKSMNPMIQELYRNKELGFLDASTHLSWRGATLIQYWKSFDHLEEYARKGQHLEAWRHFNQKVASSGVVGIYHETYLVQEGQYECFYNNMPVMGLARAGAHLPVTGRHSSARDRLGRDRDSAASMSTHPS